jgi:hypothetical protein
MPLGASSRPVGATLAIVAVVVAVSLAPDGSVTIRRTVYVPSSP